MLLWVGAVPGSAQQGEGGDRGRARLATGPGCGLPVWPHHLSQAGRGGEAHPESLHVSDHVPQGLPLLLPLHTMLCLPTSSTALYTSLHRLHYVTQRCRSHPLAHPPIHPPSHPPCLGLACRRCLVCEACFVGKPSMPQDTKQRLQAKPRQGGGVGRWVGV